jgi:hypothetical protein
VYTHLYIYTHQAANLTERLESRIFCSPEEFNNTLADREKKYGKFGWKPDSDPSQLYPGTYYLDAVCVRVEVWGGVGAGGGGMYRCDVCALPLVSHTLTTHAHTSSNTPTHTHTHTHTTH